MLEIFDTQLKIIVNENEIQGRLRSEMEWNEMEWSGMERKAVLWKYFFMEMD